MTVKEFVEKYNTLSNETLKNKLVQEIVKKEYVPILKKRLVLENMLKKSILEDKNGVRYIDMFVSKLNFTCVVLALYTNLDLTKENDYDVYNDYDLLVSNDILPKIMEEINQDEINRLLSINKQIMDTFYNKEKTTEAFINRAITQCTTVLGSMLNAGLEHYAQEDSDYSGAKNLKTIIENFKEII